MKSANLAVMAVVSLTVVLIIAGCNRSADSAKNNWPNEGKVYAGLVDPQRQVNDLLTLGESAVTGKAQSTILSGPPLNAWPIHAETADSIVAHTGSVDSAQYKSTDTLVDNAAGLNPVNNDLRQEHRTKVDELLDRYSNSWLALGALGIVMVLIALLAHAVLFTVLRRVARTRIMASTLVEFTYKPARLVFPLFVLQFIVFAAPADLRFVTAAQNLTALLLTGAITWVIMRAVAGVGEVIMRMHPADIDDNLVARRIHTQTRVLSRTVMFFVLVVGSASALMLFPSVRQIGTSILASAGVAGLVIGIAARPVLSNLIAGLQIALTQPIRIDDIVIMDGEWGRIEEIMSTYIVVKIWDERRLVVPLQWVIENPFQNWTRQSTQLLGTVLLWFDFRVPLAPLRAELEHVCRDAAEWDRRIALLQVVDADEHAMQVRALVSATDASKLWDLRCRVREALIDFVQREYPEGLPRARAELDSVKQQQPPGVYAPAPTRPGKGGSTVIEQLMHP
ncbi:MAG: mechanosensitive ion channel family protein [Sulfuricaulis sp.]